MVWVEPENNGVCASCGVVVHVDISSLCYFAYVSEACVCDICLYYSTIVFFCCCTEHVQSGVVTCVC